jgi:hypothetical protein
VSPLTVCSRALVWSPRQFGHCDGIFSVSRSGTRRIVPHPQKRSGIVTKSVLPLTFSAAGLDPRRETVPVAVVILRDDGAPMMDYSRLRIPAEPRRNLTVTSLFSSWGVPQMLPHTVQHHSTTWSLSLIFVGRPAPQRGHGGAGDRHPCRTWRRDGVRHWNRRSAG